MKKIQERHNEHEGLHIKKAMVDLKRLEMNGASDLMGLSDPRVGYEHAVVVDSWLPLCCNKVLESLHVPAVVLCVCSCVLLGLKLRHLRDS